MVLDPLANIVRIVLVMISERRIPVHDKSSFPHDFGGLKVNWKALTAAQNTQRTTREQRDVMLTVQQLS